MYWNVWCTSNGGIVERHKTYAASEALAVRKLQMVIPHIQVLKIRKTSKNGRAK